MTRARRRGRYTHAHNPDSLPEIKWPVASMKQTPGLSSFAGAPAAAGDTLVPLLEFAYEHVEAEAQRLTPVVLMATAGMRLLETHQVEAVLESCRDVLLRSRFFFKPKWASVIPGYKVHPRPRLDSHPGRRRTTRSLRGAILCDGSGWTNRP